MIQNSEEIVKGIALTKVPLVGNVIAKNLITYCGSASAVFKTPKSKLIKIPGVAEKTADNISRFKDFKIAEDELKYIQNHQVKIYFFSDPEYPFRLKQNIDAPLILFGMGNTEMNVPKVVSVVGTRSATNYGREWCEAFVSDLADSNCLIVSGLASGIDTIAHKASLKAKLNTIGVLGNGLKNIYPSQNKGLARQMIENGGSILTEYLSNTIPEKNNFPERNRIVAGMCDAIVVVETKKRGGSMITAGLAFQYDRDVFALPGKVSDENAEGCHHLIKSNKAALIENAQDLITQMRWDNQVDNKKPIQQQLFVALSPAERRIYDYLKLKGKSGIDNICFDLNLPQHSATMQLLEMEMKDSLRSLPGKQYELR